TPSRWLQVSSVPLALFAGLGAARIFGRHALLGAAAIVALSIPFTWWEYGTPSLDKDVLALGAWARERLPADALVVVRARDRERKEPGLLPDRDWWPYLLGRETDATPLPASEPRLDPRVLSKRALAGSEEAARAHARARSKRLY